ncbi:MAG TPA: hypothetical protein VIF84_03965 [Candidatus Limnocylindrales bacterium]
MTLIRRFSMTLLVTLAVGLAAAGCTSGSGSSPSTDVAPETVAPAEPTTPVDGASPSASP